MVPPVVNFSATPLTGEMPLTVSFTDLSTNTPTGWLWDFGNGDTSTSQNPTQIYTEEGVYTVSLITANGDGPGADVKLNYINVTLPVPVADFMASPIVGYSPLTVEFLDTSLFATSWVWNFGDPTSEDNVSTSQNPVHTYQNVGTYTVQLTATNNAGFDSKQQVAYIEVLNTPTLIADFITSKIEGNTVYFVDKSLGGATEWLWDFGDGNTSISQNVTHTYATPGLYNVTLQVTLGLYDEIICKQIILTSEIVGYQEIYGNIRRADGEAIKLNKHVVAVASSSGPIIGCTDIKVSTYHLSRTIQDGSVAFLVRARGAITSIADVGFEDGQLINIYAAGRMLTDINAHAIAIPFYSTLPSNPNSYINVDVVLPAPATIATPIGGTYGNRVLVTLTNNMVPSIIWYTTDGSDPIINGILYSTPIEIIEGTTTLKFYSEDVLSTNESVRTETYIVEQPLVTATPEPNFYSEIQRVKLHKNRPGIIYYSLNGSSFQVYNDNDEIIIEADNDGYMINTIQAYLVDNINLITGPTSTFTYILDFVNPVITSFSINNGATSTTSRMVVLQTIASDYVGTVTGMMLSCYPDFSDAMIQLYQPEVAFLLTEGNGLKTVYVQVVDQESKWSEVRSASINLTDALPVLTINENPTEAIGELVYTFTGTKTANASVTLKNNGSVETTIIPANASTTWSFIVHLQNGVNTLEFSTISFAGNRGNTIIKSVEALPIPVGVTEATTYAKPDGTWRIPYVYFQEVSGDYSTRINNFEIEVESDTPSDPNLSVTYPTEEDTLYQSIITVLGTATPGSLITLEVRPRSI